MSLYMLRCMHQQWNNVMVTLYNSALVPGVSPVLLSEGAASSAETASSLASTAAILASNAMLAVWK